MSDTLGNYICSSGILKFPVLTSFSFSDFFQTWLVGPGYLKAESLSEPVMIILQFSAHSGS